MFKLVARMLKLFAALSSTFMFYIIMDYIIQKSVYTYKISLRISIIIIRSEITIVPSGGDSIVSSFVEIERTDGCSTARHDNNCHNNSSSGLPSIYIVFVASCHVAYDNTPTMNFLVILPR